MRPGPGQPPPAAARLAPLASSAHSGKGGDNCHLGRCNVCLLQFILESVFQRGNFTLLIMFGSLKIPIEMGIPLNSENFINIVV